MKQIKKAWAVQARGTNVEVESVEILKEGAKTVTLVRHGGEGFGFRKLLPLESVCFSREAALSRFLKALEVRAAKLRTQLVDVERLLGSTHDILWEEIKNDE